MYRVFVMKRAVFWYKLRRKQDVEVSDTTMLKRISYAGTQKKSLLFFIIIAAGAPC